MVRNSVGLATNRNKDSGAAAIPATRYDTATCLQQGQVEHCMTDHVLPEGFSELEPFVAYWAVPGCQERRERREAATMEEIRAFYGPMLARAPDAIAYLEPLPMADLADDAKRLMELVLALMHASMAIELHGQPRAPYSPYPHGVKLVSGPALFG
jgi:hypothetical protein